MKRRTTDDVQRLLRELAPQALAIVVRRCRDFHAAEDATQEALLAASAQWPREGVPDHPRSWLVHVASCRLADHVRAETSRRRREAIATHLSHDGEPLAPAADEEASVKHDDTLELLFMCCHPALSASSAIALTLRAVGGLTTREIASAFLVPEATMAQRISRAKQTIQASGVAFAALEPSERTGRLDLVLRVIYLVFNEGYLSSSGPTLHRTDLSTEAIRLARLVHATAPREPEAAGLLALLLLTDARRAARTGPSGELVPLDEQDRTAWDAQAIAEGTALLTETLPLGRPGTYQVQAAIAAVHDEADRADATDWPQILALYALLERIEPGPAVALGHAIAFAMVHGPRAGIARLDALAADARIAGSHRWIAARAHLLERAGDAPAAIDAYARAAEATTSIVERDFLVARAARLRDRLS